MYDLVEIPLVQGGTAALFVFARVLHEQSMDHLVQKRTDQLFSTQIRP